MSFWTANFCIEYLKRFGTETNDPRTLEILERDLEIATAHTSDWIRQLAPMVRYDDETLAETHDELETFRSALAEVKRKRAQ